MKQITTIFIMLLSLTLFSQNETTVIEDFTKDVNEKMELMEDVKTTEEFIIHYGKKLMSIGEITIEKAVEIINTEVPIVVKQFLAFQSIKYGLLLLLGFILLFYLTKRIKSWFSIDTKTAVAYNQSIDDDDKPEYKKKNKYMKIYGLYFKNVPIFSSYILSTIASIGLGSYLIITNILIFIKVTLLPKLYLIELIVKNI